MWVNKGCKGRSKRAQNSADSRGEGGSSDSPHCSLSSSNGLSRLPVSSWETGDRLLSIGTLAAAPALLQKGIRREEAELQIGCWTTGEDQGKLWLLRAKCQPT